MGSTALSVTNQLLTSTAYSYHKELRDTLDHPTRFLTQVEKKGKMEVEGGERMIVGWKFLRHSQTTQLSTGYEPINLDVNPLGVPGNEQWGDWIRPIVISGHEMRINRGSPKILSILEERVKDTEMGMRVEWEEASLIGTATNMSDMVTLNGFDNSDGFLEEAAIGAQNNTIHNVARSGARLTDGFQNQRYDGAGSFSANGLVGLYDIVTRIRRLVGDPSKLHGWGSLAGMTNIKRALNSNERYLSEKELDAGRQVLVYSGVPLEIVDLPNAGSTTTGDPWTFMFLDHGEIQWVSQKGFHFKMAEFEGQPGYNVRAAYLHLMGQWCGKYFGSSGVLFDAESWT